MARMTGLEPATFGVTGRRSNQLSYIRNDVARSLEKAESHVKHGDHLYGCLGLGGN
jgi:hypothetical protein